MARLNSVAIYFWFFIWLISYVIADLENTHYVRKPFFYQFISFLVLPLTTPLKKNLRRHSFSYVVPQQSQFTTFFHLDRYIEVVIANSLSSCLIVFDFIFQLRYSNMLSCAVILFIRIQIGELETAEKDNGLHIKQQNVSR